VDEFAHPAGVAAAETRRFFFVRDRDGLEAAVAWAKRTIEIYEKALADPKHHASKEPYRRNIEYSTAILKSLVAGAEEHKTTGETSVDEGDDAD
jgi:hypothetical protein